MLDIQRRDRQIFLDEVARPSRLIWSALLSAPFWIAFFNGAPVTVPIVLSTAVFVGHFLLSHKSALARRFYSKRYEALWNTVVDRMRLFDEVRERLARERISEWQEMPKTVERVAKSLYLALRRADMIAHEVTLTEKGLYNSPSPWKAPSHDPEAKDLYRMADKNIAEYRSQFAMVMAGVHRTEAQCAVFMTTVDTLRMKLIGYRLVGKSPEMSNPEFLDAMTEAKLQLSAIDQALDELELGAYRSQLGGVPPLEIDSDAVESVPNEGS
jgi:hypothetical protein